MTKRAILLAVVIIVAVAAVGVWIWRARDTRPPRPERPPVTVPDAIPVDKVALASPDLAVGLIGMRGTVHPTYTDWSCILECREPEGCHADIELTVEYRSDGEPRKLILGGRIDGAEGEAMRVGRVQRPPVSVDSIDRVSMVVRQVHRTDAPRPTEIE